MKNLLSGTVVKIYGEEDEIVIDSIIESKDDHVKYSAHKNNASRESITTYDNLIYEIISVPSVQLENKASTELVEVKRSSKRDVVRDEAVAIKEQPYVVITDTVQSYLSNFVQTKREKCRIVTECVHHLQNYNEEEGDNIVAEVIIKLSRKLERSLKSKSKS